MIDTAASLLQDEDRFVVVTHVNPDGDAVGSLLGMTRALSEMGKQACALVGEPLPDMYDFLAGCDETWRAPDKIPFHPKFIIALDAAERNRISGDIDSFQGKSQLINIDHHPTNPGYGDLNCVLAKATSTAEIVFEILDKAHYSFSADVAKCLYTGIITDTGGFRFPGVNSRTHMIASRLLETGFDPYQITRRLYEEYPLRRVQLECLVLERMEVLLDGKLIISTLLQEDFTRIGARLSDTEDLVNRLRQITGVEAGVLITEVSSELTRVSFRSKDLLDVSAIAASLGGGGHVRAAGLKSPLRPNELKSRIIAAIKDALDHT